MVLHYLRCGREDGKVLTRVVRYLADPSSHSGQRMSDFDCAKANCTSGSQAMPLVPSGDSHENCRHIRPSRVSKWAVAVNMHPGAVAVVGR